MMSSSGFRPFDELSEHYEDEWLQLGLDDETLKCGSSPTNGTSDFGLSVATRLCPSPLSHIPTREPYLPEPPPKLSPVSAEQQTFITLSNSRIPSVPPAPSQPVLQPPSQGQSSELATIEYELNPDMNVLSIPSSSPVLVTKPADLQFTQPSVSGLQQNGDFSSFVQLEQREKRTVIQSQQHPPSCVQTVNGQWFVQAQVQHVQTSAGTVIAVVPNFCRPQAHPPVGTVAQSMPQVQVSQSQLIAHSLANVQTVGTAHSAVTAATAQHVLQNHHQIQQQQQPQQIVNAARLPSSLTVGVATSSTPQQGQSVMQHLLSQPTISRPHTQGTVQAVNLTSTNAKKQRIFHPRNGRKKNCNQGGTLGAVLAKANKLAAASSTDASLNQLLPPTHGIEMRLSVQNSEQVASLSKEISRLQNIQAVYNVDHSAEIKDLENKRAQIFFEALAQQHKDKDLLSAANPKSITSLSSQRQRNHKINHNSAHTTIVVHQVQPSTSSEQQQQQHHPQHHSHSQHPNYEAGNSARIPISYQNSFQMSNYTPPLESLQQNCSFNTRRNNLISQGTTAQYSSYRTTVSQPAPTVHHNQVQETYIQTLPNAIQHPAVIMQTERHIPPPSAPPPPPSAANSCMITKLPCDQTPPPVQLYPPPVLRSSAEAAACIAEKRTERAKKLGDYFAALRHSLEHPDLSSPFHDLSNAFERLIPYHIYFEPDFNSEILDTFDYNCQRHFVHLYNRKNIIEQRLRSLLFKEAMEGFSKTDECLLLSLDLEHERRLLDEEKRMAIVTDKEEFVAKSAICGRVTVEEINRRRKELVPKSMPKLHFDYHAFSEAEVSARVISPFTNSDDEDTSSKNLTGIDEDGLSDDLNGEATHLGQTTSKTAVENSTNESKLAGSVETLYPTEEECLDELFQKNMAESNCVDSSLLLELTSSSNCCNSRRRSDKNKLSPVTVVNSREQMLAEKNIPSIKSTEQLEAIIALAHAASLERIPSPVTAEENESIENCVPMEDASKISETEITSCDNDSTQNLEHKSVEIEKTKRPPIRIKIALTDVGLKNCMNKSSSKKSRDKKKKKRKHCSFVETTYNNEVNGLLPSCSGLEDLKSGNTTSSRDDTSHPRILMRITRKNNVVSVTDSRINQASVQLAPKGEGEEERAPEPKVPKLKIRLGRNREEYAVETENLALDCVSNNVMHEVSRLKVNFGDGDCDRHKHTAGMEHGRKMTIVIPKSVVTKSYSSSCNWSSSISEVVSSSAQFSPNSELSDEESHEQLRAQTDNVISRLNDWGNTNRVKPQEDTLSRMVATAPLANSALDRLLPTNSWLFNMDMRNHTTTTDNADSSISSPHMSWLTSATSRMQQTATCSNSRRLKTTLSTTTKSHK